MRLRKAVVDKQFRRLERAAAMDIGTRGPIGAMRQARSEEKVVLLGWVALQLGFTPEIVTEGFAAYMKKEDPVWY